MFAGLWAKLIGVLGALGAVLLGVLAIFAKGKRAGADEVQAAGLKKEAENVKTANEVEQSVARSKPGDADKRLRDKWSRD